MKLKKHFKANIIAHLLMALALLLICSCTTKELSGQKDFNQEEVNSIFSLIREGRNTQLSIEERKNVLEKARNAISDIDNDSIRTKLFSRLSLAYLRLEDSLKFRNTNRITVQLAQISNDSTTLAEAQWDLAEFFRDFAIADSAYYHFSEAQKIFEQLGQDYESGRMLYNMAIAQADVKDYTGSEISTIRAIEILKPFERSKQLFSSYNNLGSVTQGLKEYDRAIEYYNTALEYQKKIEEDNNLDLIIKNNIGIVYQERADYNESIPYFEEVINQKSLLNIDPQLYAKALNNLAYSRLKAGQNNDVREQLERAIKIQDSIEDIGSISRSHFNLAEYFLNEQDTLNALAQAKKAKSYAEMARNNERILQTLQLLVKIAPDNSSNYTQEYIALNDRLQQEERQIRDKFARIRFETDEFIAENQMLAREKQLWTSIAIAVLLLGLMSYIILDQRTKNQKLRFQQDQQAANQEIFNLMLDQKQKVEEGKKLEQKRISEELHDGVLGKMLGARMVLTGLNKKTDNESAIQREKAIDALQDVEKEVRAISHELSHAAYEKMHNFILSLEDLLNSVKATAEFDCQLNYDEAFDWDLLNGETKINLYRMIQESLQNCVKHAQCNNVEVKLDAEETDLKVVVADDGKGFKMSSGKKGIGMRNIGSRISKLNGEWNIKGAPGKGTTVTLKIPLDVAISEKINSNGNQELEEEFKS